MSKFTCLLFCTVVVSISSVYAAVGEDEKAAFREALKPALEECAKEQGVNTDELENAKEAVQSETLKPGAVKPCFVGCMLKKTGIMNSKGEIDLDAGLEKVKKYVKHDEDYAKFAEIGKLCAAVNDHEVSDGEQGCERADHFVSCITEHKAELPL